MGHRVLIGSVAALAVVAVVMAVVACGNAPRKPSVTAAIGESSVAVTRSPTLARTTAAGLPTATPTATSATPAKAPSPALDAPLVFTGRGAAISAIFPRAAGHLKIALTITGNDRRFAPDNWKFELFRHHGNELILEDSGHGAADQWRGEILITDASWDLWFRLDVGDDANWRVTLEQIGDAPTPTPQTTTAPQPTPTPTRTPSPTPTPVPVAVPSEYTVQAGDTLRTIAKQFGTTVDDLIEANDIEDPNLIRVGARLKIPASATGAPAPTATPTRTPRSQPTATAAACPTTAEAAYLLAYGEQLTVLGEAGELLGGLFADAADNPFVILTDDFAFAAGINLGLMQFAAQSILELTPPNSRKAREIHAVASGMARATINAADLVAAGIDEFDTDKLERGVRLIETAGDDILRTAGMIERFCE